MKKRFTFLIAAIAAILMMAQPMKVMGQTYEELYSANFTSLSAFSYTQNKEFTLSNKTWIASTCQVNSNVFYLGCSSNTAAYGVLNNNTSFSNEVAALRSADSKYSSNNNYTTAHAYAMRFDNSYSNVTKVEFTWSGGNNAFQVYLFGDSGSGYVKLASTNYASSGTSTSGSVTWTGDATNFTKFAIVARPGTTTTIVTTNKTLRAATFKIYKTQTSSVTAPTINPTAVNSFEDELEVSLTVAQGTTAYYNINSNTDPTSESTPYTAPFNISASSTIKAIAYDGNLNPSSVVSKEYTKEEFANIEDVDTDKAYKVRGTVVATNTRGFMLADNSGYVYVYLYDKNNNSNPTLPNVNDKRKVNGTPGTYGKVIEYKYGCTVTEATGTTFTSDTPNVIDGDDMYGVIQDNEHNYLSAFEQFEGTLSCSDGKYTISVDGNEHNATAQISYPNSTQTEALDGLVDKTVRVQGYFTGLSSGNYTVMLGSIVEVVNPTITADPTSLTFTYVSGGSAAAKTLTIEGGNLSEGITATITTGDDKFSISADEETWGNSLVLPAAGDLIAVRLNSGITTTGTYNGVITLSSTGAESVTVTLTGTVTTPTHNIALYPTPSGHGTITLPETTIIPEGSTVTLSAEPADGYDFGSWKLYKKVDAEYELINNITVSNNQFTMPTYDVWVDATFTAKPTYEITKSIDPANSGTIETDAYAWAGKNVIVLVEAESGYAFSSIAVTKTGDSSTEITTSGNATDGFTFEMPAYPVTVTATFVLVLDITFTVNGTQKTVKHINQGSQIGELPTLLDSEIPSGFSFMGWTASTNYFSYDDAPELIYASTEPESNTTYAAVFAQTDMSKLSTGTLTSSEILSEFAAAHGYNDAEEEYTDSDDGITWSAKYIGKAERAWLQLKSDNNVYIKIVAPNTIRRVDLTITSTQNDKGGEADITKHTAFSSSGYIYLNSSNGASTHAGSVLGSAVSSNEVSITPTGNNTTLYVQVSTGARVWGISVKHGALSYMNYTTIVTDVDVIGSVTDLRIFESISATDAVTNSGTIHIFAGGILDMDTYQLTNETAANLIIEDGGQLIFKTPLGKAGSVKATLKKEIDGFGGDNTVQTGWYTIASPLTANFTPATDMLTETYDLYYFDEAGMKWKNYRKETFEIIPEKGYLYANTADKTISFAGDVLASDAEVENTLSYTVSGFNLMGNPFTCNITKDSDATLAGESFESYYIANGTIDGNGKNLLAFDLNDREIKPCEGFIVQATNTGQTLAFNKSGAKRGGTTAKSSFIRIEAGNKGFMDRAYIHFGNANTLRKLSISDETPQVYVMQDGKDYAAATIQEAQGEMPVNFKAYVAGEYTITVNPEVVEMGYLHLIDNIAGKDVDLLATPSYTFNARTDDYESRFRLVFSSNMANAEMGEDFAFFSNGQLVIANEGEAILQVIDVTGRVVATESINGTCSKAVNAKAGVYVLRLINGTDVKTQKMVIR